MNIKVLHILSGDLWGGAEAQMGLQIQAQRALGLNSQVILFNPGETRDRYLQLGIPLEVVSEKLGFAKLFSEALRSAKMVNPHVIVSHGYKETFVASYISLFSKIPLISTIHGGTENYIGFKALKAYLYSKLSFLLARYVAKSTIVPTQDLKRKLKLNSEVIGNVSDISSPTTDLKKLRSEIGFDVSQPLLVWVGRIVPVKCLDRAIHAIKILQTQGVEVNLAIVGTGELRDTNELLVKSLDLEGQVKFLGFRSDAGALIGAADILLLTSDSEGLPTVMAEAMTQGTKLVMSDLLGIQEIAERFKGYPIELISPFTPEAFALGIKKSLNQFSQSPQEILRETRTWFNPERAAKEALVLYQRILAQ